MIASLRGCYRGRSGEAIIVEASGVGYEVLLPPIVEQALAPLTEGKDLDLRIAYVATRDQPAPMLYGFAREEEKQFWNLMRSVPRVGPRLACRALVLPINRIAQAIGERNVHLVDSLPGIGAQGAEKIVASLRTKVAAFASLEESSAAPEPATDDELRRLAIGLLVEMGIRRPDAMRDVGRILRARPELRSVEDVVMEYFRQ